MAIFGRQPFLFQHLSSLLYHTEGKRKECVLGAGGVRSDGVAGTPSHPSPWTCIFISRSRCYGVTRDLCASQQALCLAEKTVRLSHSWQT